MTSPSATALQNAAFRKSTFSDPQQSCVEIAHVRGALGFRDSKLTGSPVLAFASESGMAFIQAVKAGVVFGSN